MGAIAAATIAGAAISTAGTIAATSMQADASKKAAGSQTKISKDYSKQLQAATDQYNANMAGISAAVSNIDTNIKIPQYSLLGTPDVYKKNKKGEIIYNKKTGEPKIKSRGKASAVLEGILAANKVTENALYQLETVLPGAADARARAMESLANWEQKLEQQYEQVQKAYPMLEKAEAGFGQATQRYEQAGKVLQEQLPQIAEARKVAGEYLLGDLPDVTKRQITRAIAEAGGAGYNPAAASRTSGFQVPQGMLSENLAQAAEERQRFGLSAISNITGQTAAMAAGQSDIAGGQSNIAQGLQGVGMAYGQAGAASANIGEAFRGMQATNMAWQNLSQGFLQNVPQMMQVGLAGRGQDIQKRQIEIDAQLRQQELLANMATSQFNAQTGAAQGMYGAAQDRVSANLASRQAGAQMYSDIGQGIGNLLSSGAGAYNQYATAAAARPTYGYGGQQYIPSTSSTGGQYYKPASGSIF